MQHEDLVGLQDRAESVLNDGRRASEYHLGYCALDVRLDLGIHRTRRLVEHEQGRIRRHGAGKGEQLSLTDTDARATFCQLVTPSARQSSDHAVGTDTRR